MNKWNSWSEEQKSLAVYYIFKSIARRVLSDERLNGLIDMKAKEDINRWLGDYNIWKKEFDKGDYGDLKQRAKYGVNDIWKKRSK
jgi:hypothetical protein